MTPTHKTAITHAMRNALTQAALQILFSLALLATAATARTLSLDGKWNFVTENGSRLSPATLAGQPKARQIAVPGTWQSQFADLRDYAGAAWYWRTVTVPALDAGHVALLRFDAVDYRADVYVNGREAGSHDGGYLPFTFDVTRMLHPGPNQIAVRVVDPGAKPSSVEGIRYAEIPHGKQSWYVQASGLWQSVALEIRPLMHLGEVHITAGADRKFIVQAHVANPESRSPNGEPGTMIVQLMDPSHHLVEEWNQAIEAGKRLYTVAGQVDDAELWSPSDPELYSVHVWLSSGDTADYPFGFRTFEARHGKFYLNGKAIFLRGALDQDFYPRTGYTLPSRRAVLKQMAEAKNLGLNLLRCHIKAPDPRYLQAADEAGLLVWYEIPSWDRLTPNSERRALGTLQGMVARDWNHPSIVIVSIINESWGANLKNAADRQWLKGAYASAKKLTPGWLVDDNSACCSNFHLQTDIADFHNYSAIPEHTAAFDHFVDQLSLRAKWLFSPYGDAAPAGNEPLVLSEFGNWGLPRVPSQRPWWFNRSFENNPLTVPAGVHKRFQKYDLAAIFGRYGELADATQLHEGEALVREVDALRSKPQIAGYVITEFTDVHWESNGLLDFWRKPKAFAARLAQAQEDDAVIPRVATNNTYAGKTVRVSVYFSHYSQTPLDAAQVVWELEGSSLKGSFNLPKVSEGGVIKAGGIVFAAPAAKTPTAHALRLRVVDGDTVLCENTLPIFVYPAPATPRATVAFHNGAGGLGGLAQAMQLRHYRISATPARGTVLLASSLDATVQQSFKNGETVLLFAGGRQTIAHGLTVVPRRNSVLDGDWISSFPWVRTESQPFTTLHFDALQGFESAAITPEAVIKGVPAAHYDDVLAGIFYGWIRSNVATLVQARVGAGRLLITTFALPQAYGRDAYATALLDRLVAYATTQFQPKLEVAPATQ